MMSMPGSAVEIDVDKDWADRYLARHAEIIERRLCPKCGEPLREPAGVSLDYNRVRHDFTTKVAGYEGYEAERLENDSLPPWEDWLADQFDTPLHYIVCADCVAREGGLPSAPPEQWYRDS
jgi:hypothetical protein